MNYKHRQTFVLTVNNDDSKDVIDKLRKWIVQECGVTPKVLQNNEMIALEWEKEGVIVD